MLDRFYKQFNQLGLSFGFFFSFFFFKFLDKWHKSSIDHTTKAVVTITHISCFIIAALLCSQFIVIFAVSSPSASDDTLCSLIKVIKSVPTILNSTLCCTVLTTSLPYSWLICYGTDSVRFKVFPISICGEKIIKISRIVVNGMQKKKLGRSCKRAP